MKLLSETQKDILKKMRNGYTLTAYKDYTGTHYRLQKGKPSEGGFSITLSERTVKALFDAGVIEVSDKRLHLTKVLVTKFRLFQLSQKDK
jgi:hypothetical protein